MGKRKYTKRTTKQRLREKADRAWIMAVLRKYGNRCILCSNSAYTAHHFFPKSISQALRYEVSNGIPICSKHHFRRHTTDDPSIDLLIVANRGQKWLNELKKQRDKEVSFTLRYLKEQIKRLGTFKIRVFS